MVTAMRNETSGIEPPRRKRIRGNRKAETISSRLTGTSFEQRGPTAVTSAVTLLHAAERLARQLRAKSRRR